MPADFVVPQEPIPDRGSNADADVQEARLLQAGDLEQQARKHRSSRMRHMHWIGIGALWVLALVVFVISIMSLWHFVTPPAWHFLEADQVSRLHTVTVTSIVSALLTFVVQEATRAS